MATNSFKVGDTICLQGVSRHGKNRIEQHGEIWTIREISQFIGRPAMLVESEKQTFTIKTRDAAKTEEWTSKKVKDTRWVHISNDDNFVIVGEAA